MNKLFSLIVLVGLISYSYQVLGVDVSQAVSESQFQCMKQNNYDFAIVRGYCSYGGIDSNAKQTLTNAKAAGLYHDTYHFPCMGKVSPTDQANAIVNYLGNLPGIYWIDVETNPSPGCGWQSASANCNFLKELVSAFKARSVKVGIYASYYMWETIFGSASACPDFTDLQLWYANYSGGPNFNNFQAFGGWTKPNIKQYSGTSTLCGVGVDLDYYP